MSKPTPHTKPTTLRADRVLFKRKSPTPIHVQKASELWVELFTVHVDTLLEWQLEHGAPSTDIARTNIINTARAYADEELETIQERWPGVIL